MREMMKKRIIYFGLISFALTACSNTTDTKMDTSIQDSTSIESLNKINNEESGLYSGEILSSEQSSGLSQEESNPVRDSFISETDSTEIESISRVYTEEEKRAILQEFLDWTSYRAEIGGMVVSDYYLAHGASGPGDWYANTENGEIQIQDIGRGIPGYDNFLIHALGGVVFYTSLEELYGFDSRPYQQAIAMGFSRLADPNMPLTRYLLGDDGIIYELKGSLIELGNFHGGYGLYEEDGSKAIDSSSYIFEVSKDGDAQEKYMEILSKYN